MDFVYMVFLLHITKGQDSAMGCCWSTWNCDGHNEVQCAVSAEKCVPIPAHTLHEPEYLRRCGIASTLASENWGESWIVFGRENLDCALPRQHACATKHYRRGEWTMLMERRSFECDAKYAWISVNDLCPKRLCGNEIAIHAWREGLCVLLEKAEDSRRKTRFV